MDERAFYAAVAERAALSKEEAADLTRASLEALAAQISGGELTRLAASLPDWLAVNLPRHDRSAKPVPFSQFTAELGRRTGLREDEAERGVRAVLGVLREAVGPAHLEHALDLLPKDYRESAAA